MIATFINFTPNLIKYIPEQNVQPIKQKNLSLNLYSQLNEENSRKNDKKHKKNSQKSLETMVKENQFTHYEAMFSILV